MALKDRGRDWAANRACLNITLAVSPLLPSRMGYEWQHGSCADWQCKPLKRTSAEELVWLHPMPHV